MILNYRETLLFFLLKSNFFFFGKHIQIDNTSLSVYLNICDAIYLLFYYLSILNLYVNKRNKIATDLTYIYKTMTFFLCMETGQIVFLLSGNKKGMGFHPKITCSPCPTNKRHTGHSTLSKSFNTYC